MAQKSDMAMVMQLHERATVHLKSKENMETHA
jgi:hypothetical protein